MDNLGKKWGGKEEVLDSLGKIGIILEKTRNLGNWKFRALIFGNIFLEYLIYILGIFDGIKYSKNILHFFQEYRHIFQKKC